MDSSEKASRFSYGDGPSQFVIVRRPTAASPSGNYPLAIILHGGFWKGKYGLDPPTSAIESVAPSLLSHGIMTAEVEYRRSGDISWGAGYTDADVATAYAACLTLRDADGSRVVVVGHSAGGMLALSLLFKRRANDQLCHAPALVIALAPVADLCRAAELRLSDSGDAVQRYMGGEPAQRREEYARACPACRATELLRGRVVVVSGSRDSDVPAAYVREFSEKVKRHNPTVISDKWELIEIEQADHFDIVNSRSEFWRLILPFILSAAFPGSRPSTSEI